MNQILYLIDQTYTNIQVCFRRPKILNGIGQQASLFVNELLDEHSESLHSKQAPIFARFFFALRKLSLDTSRWAFSIPPVQRSGK